MTDNQRINDSTNNSGVVTDSDIKILRNRIDLIEKEQFINDFENLSDTKFEYSIGNPRQLFISIVNKYRRDLLWFKKNKYFNKAEVEAIKRCKECAQIARRFIECVLIESNSDCYSINILEFFKELGYDFSLVCTLLIQNRSIHEIGNRNIIFSIALNGEKINENIIDIVINHLKDINNYINESENFRKVEQKNLDFEYASYEVDKYLEELDEFNEYLRMIVTNKRSREGYRWILNHKSMEYLIEPWIVSLKSDSEIDVEEVNYIINKCNLNTKNKIILCDIICKVDRNVFRDNVDFEKFLINGLVQESDSKALTKFLQVLYCFNNANEMNTRFSELKEKESLRQRILIYYSNEGIENYLELNYLDPAERYKKSIEFLLNKDEIKLSNILNSDDFYYHTFNKEEILLLKELIYDEQGEFTKDLLASIAVIALAQTEENIEDISEYILRNSK